MIIHDRNLGKRERREGWRCRRMIETAERVPVSSATISARLRETVTCDLTRPAGDWLTQQKRRGEAVYNNNGQYHPLKRGTMSADFCFAPPAFHD